MRSFVDGQPLKSEADAIGYGPATPGDWGEPAPKSVQEALDNLAHLKTGTGIYYHETPVAADAFPLKGIPRDATLTYADYLCDDAGADTGTVTFNVEQRATATPFTAGTDIWAADKTATTTSANVTAFTVPAVTAREELWVTITSVANSPTKFRLKLEWIVD